MWLAAKIIGAAWIAAVVTFGVWLGFAGVFMGVGGLIFESGYGDIWILAIVAVPGYFVWKWGTAENHRMRRPMPKGPKGEKRPADVIGAAVKVMQIATGEVEEDIGDDGKNKAAQELGRLGGQARAEKLSKKQRSKIAKMGAKARWAGKRS